MIKDMRYPYCPKCEENFPIRESLYDGYERSGKTFYCPNGHALVVMQDSIVSQLRASERFLQYAQSEVKRLYKQLEGTRGVITRQRNRLIRGVCPYCGKGVTQIDVTMMQHIRERHSK